VPELPRRGAVVRVRREGKKGVADPMRRVVGLGWVGRERGHRVVGLGWERARPPPKRRALSRAALAKRGCRAGGLHSLWYRMGQVVMHPATAAPEVAPHGQG
jgi:hypothetical protein